MTRDDELEDSAVPNEPWAPGGSMSTSPIPPPPRFFGQASAGPTDDEAPAYGEGPTDEGPADEGRADDEAPADTPDGEDDVALPRATRIAIAIVVVVLVGVAGVWVVRRERPSDVPIAEPVPTRPLFNPPGTTLVRPPTEVLVGGIGEPPIIEVARLDAVIAIPAALDALAPVELVVLTEQGEVIVVDTSTGTAESALAGPPFTDPVMTASDNAFVLWSEGSNSVVVGRRGKATVVLLDAGGPVAGVVAEYDDEFLLQPVPGSGRPREIRLEQVASASEIILEIGDAGSALAHPGGDLMVSADDGTYLLAVDGPRRISEGFVAALGPNHLLFSDCIGDQDCTLVLDDVAAGVQTVVPDAAAAELERGPQPYHLSPDGTAVALMFMTDPEPKVRLVELDTGAILDFPAPTIAVQPTLSWAPDSSGLFDVVDGAVVFRDRTTGQVTELTALTELLAPGGGAKQVAVRPATPLDTGEGGTFAIDLSGPTGLDIAALTRDGDVIRLDLDAGAYTTYSGLPPRPGGAQLLFADEAGVTVASPSDVPGFRLDYGGEPQPTDGDAISGDVYPGPLPGTLWRRPPVSFGSTDFDLIDLFGEQLGDRIRVDDAFVLGSDGRGALILTTVGGNYVATPEGTNRITPGELIASGPTAVYARECDEVLTCGVVRIDRATGERSTPGNPTLAAAPLFQQNLRLTGRAVAPDGDVLLVQVSPYARAWSIVDVAAGTELGVPGPQDWSSIVWSDDSRFAVYLSADRLRVYDRSTGALITVPDLPELSAFSDADAHRRVATPEHLR